MGKHVWDETSLLPSSFAQVDFVGGDKPKEDCKDVKSDEVENYRQALQELVKAVSIAHALGKTLSDYVA